MKHTINIHQIHRVNGVEIDCGYDTECKSVEDARAIINQKRDAGYGDGYTYEIVKVCDDVEAPDYCHIVEVIETIEG